MNEPSLLASAANAAHSLALELYRFTSRWPECEREGLTLEVRRAGRDLSNFLREAYGMRGRALRRAVEAARGKHARLSYLIRFATDMGYRRLSSSGKVDEMLTHLDIELDVLVSETREDSDLTIIDGIVQCSGKNAHAPRRRRNQ